MTARNNKIIVRTHRLSRSLAHTSPAAGESAPVRSLLATTSIRREELSLSSDLRFLRQALSRMVRGGVYLLGGSPGAGKSLLSAQLGLNLGREGLRTLFVLTEQSQADLVETAARLSIDWHSKSVARAMAAIQVEDRLYDVGCLPSLVTHQVLNAGGQYHGINLLVLDSIQGNGLAPAATKSYGKVLEAARLLAESGITTILVSHVTKRGELAGPRLLEHGVDVTLVLRRALHYSLLSVRKNRFGPPVLKPIPLRIDPITTRLAPAPHIQAAPGAAKTYVGAGSGTAEIQVSVSIPPDGQRGRMTAMGLPRREIEQLIEVIGQIDHLDLSDLEYKIQCRLPRSGAYQTTFGLALCMAIVASYTRRSIPVQNLYLGEVDLFRKVLPVPSEFLRSLSAAIDAGDIPTPLTIVAAPTVADGFPPSAAVKMIRCNTLDEAIIQTWPDLRPPNGK